MRRHLPMIKFHISVMSALVLSLVCGVMAGIAYLSFYPYSLSYKKSEILTAINAQTTDFNVDFAEIEISQFDFKPGILIENALITTHTSTAKILVPRIELAYSFSNIFRLTLKPTSVRFHGARLVVEKSASNIELPQVPLKVEAPSVTQDYIVPKPRPNEIIAIKPEHLVTPEIGETVLNEAANALSAITSDGAGTEIATLKDFVLNIQGLMKHPIWKVLPVETIAIDRAKLVFSSHESTPELETSLFNVRLERPDTQNLIISASGIGSSEKWIARLNAQRLSTNIYEVGTEISGLRLHDFAPKSVWGKLDAPISLVSKMQMNTSGFVQSVHLDASLGAGKLLWDEEKNITSHIMSANIKAQTDETKRYLNIVSSSIQADGLATNLEGFIKLPHPQDQDQAVGIVLQANDIQLSSETPNSSFTIPVAHFRGAYELSTSMLSIDHIGIEGDKIAANGAGMLDFSGRGPVVRFAARTLQPFDAQTLKALWPKGLIPDARDWAFKNLLKAQIMNTRFSASLTKEDLNAMLNYKPIPEDHFQFFGTISNAEYRIEGSPAIVATSEGRFQTIGSRFEFSQADAKAMMPDLPDVTIKDLVYLIEDSSARIQQAQLQADLSGEVATFVQFLKQANLLKLQQNEVELLSRVNGQFSGRQVLQFPLKPKIDDNEFRYDFKAKITALTIPNFWKNISLEQAKAEIAVTQDQFNMSGNGSVFGLSVPFQLQKDAHAVGNNAINIETLVNDDLRNKIFSNTNFPFSGVTPLKITIGHTSDPNIFGLEIDLKQAKIALEAAGYEKPIGVPAVFKCDRVIADGKVVFEDFSFQSPELSGTGTAEISTEGKLVNLTMPELAWGQVVKDRFALEMNSKEQKASIKVVAKKLDARPFIKKFTLGTASSGDDFADMNFELSAKQALGFSNVTLDDVTIQAEKKNGLLVALKLSAAKNQSPMLVGEIQKDGKGPFMFISSTDAGEILKFANISESVRGGRLQFSEYLARGKAQETSGVLFLTDFVIDGDKTISGLKSSVPVDHKIEPKTYDNSFEKLRLEFVRGAKEITIRDSVMRGASMGLTFEGVIDPKRDLLDLTGTFVPLYGLNNAFSKIPVLGAFLGGGDKNEGLLGITYAVRGSISNSVLQINPMSAIAPGFLRRLFDFQPQPLQNTKQ